MGKSHAIGLLIEPLLHAINVMLSTQRETTAIPTQPAVLTTNDPCILFAIRLGGIRLGLVIATLGCCAC